MASINLENTAAAYDYLAETEAGRAAIADWEAAVDRLQDAIEPDLNRSEFVTVLRGLAQGINLVEADEDEVEGFAFNFSQMQSFASGDLRRVELGSTRFLPSRTIGSFTHITAQL